MLFQVVKDAYALCRTAKQGDWESPVFTCLHSPNDPGALFIKKGKYFVRVNRKLEAADYYHTMDGKTTVIELFGAPEYLIQRKSSTARSRS